MTLAQSTGDAGQSSSRRSASAKQHTKSDSLSLHRIATVLLIFDVATLFLSGAIPAALYSRISVSSLHHYIAVTIIGTLLFVLMAQILKAYDTERILKWNRTIGRAVVSLVMMFFTLIMAAVATKIVEDYSRVWFYSWIFASIGSIVFVRVVALALTEAKLARGAYLQRVLVISCVANSDPDIQLSLQADNRIRVVGTLTAANVDAVPDLAPYIQLLRPEVIVLELPWGQIEHANQKFRSLSHYALEVLILPETSVCMQNAIRLRRVGRQNLLQIMEPPLAAWDREIKRFADIVVAILALFLAAPLLMLVALAIKLESKGPVLFKQTRVGFNGDLIEVWKFRSMRIGDTDLHASRQTSRDDPRVTRVGRFIRRTSLDELPQFWNVLQGQMSVVGPRPHALKTSAEGEALDAIVDEYMARHRVKPGITGWAQVNGARGELHSREQVKQRLDYDLYYIEHWSVFFDIKIILITAMKVLFDAKAY